MRRPWTVVQRGAALVALLGIGYVVLVTSSRDDDYDNVPLAFRDLLLFITQVSDRNPGVDGVDEMGPRLREEVRQYVNEQKWLFHSVVDDGNIQRVLVGDRGAAVDLSYIPCGRCEGIVILMQARTRDGQVFRVWTVTLSRGDGKIEAETAAHAMSRFQE